jgi:hypothetical protein
MDDSADTAQVSRKQALRAVLVFFVCSAAFAIWAWSYYRGRKDDAQRKSDENIARQQELLRQSEARRDEAHRSMLQEMSKKK